MGNVNPTLGGKLSAHFSFSKISNGNKVSITGSFKGSIVALTPQGGGVTLLTLASNGGSIKLSEKIGAVSIKATAVPNGSPILVTVSSSNSFLHLGETDIFQPGSPAGLGGQLITIVI